MPAPLVSGSSIEPMISASSGGCSGAKYADATEPVATSTRSPMPLPRTSNAISVAPSSTSTSRSAPFGSASSRRVDHTIRSPSLSASPLPFDLDAEGARLVARQRREHGARREHEPRAGVRRLLARSARSPRRGRRARRRRRGRGGRRALKVERAARPDRCGRAGSRAPSRRRRRRAPRRRASRRASTCAARPAADHLSRRRAAGGSRCDGRQHGGHRRRRGTLRASGLACAVARSASSARSCVEHGRAPSIAHCAPASASPLSGRPRARRTPSPGQVHPAGRADHAVVDHLDARRLLGLVGREDRVGRRLHLEHEQRLARQRHRAELVAVDQERVLVVDARDHRRGEDLRRWSPRRAAPSASSTASLADRTASVEREWNSR